MVERIPDATFHILEAGLAEQRHIVFHLARMACVVRLAKFVVDHYGASVGSGDYTVGARTILAVENRTLVIHAVARSKPARRLVALREHCANVGNDSVALCGIGGQNVSYCLVSKHAVEVASGAHHAQNLVVEDSFLAFVRVEHIW